MMKNNWIHCPLCKSKTRLKARSDTLLKNFPLYCPKCRQETLISITNLKLKILTEPDA
ncbi:cysteine-rich KTR domain-containing protein [Ruminococcus sp. OA3]|uniref:cysteine-rich KTR domain-containing protein n=1 Tax=Ruminococcus sp. OA3 TaxID=2914164 RepID=UPI001F05B8D9|nr:cysteine-rich KTR domain-containing protein [Ruminococcus sp. OA3]MCH1982542.1 cysteine-rich KTR domain-containing protein [Ruminococcus sp. OA3]